MVEQWAIFSSGTSTPHLPPPLQPRAPLTHRQLCTPSPTASTVFPHLAPEGNLFHLFALSTTPLDITWSMTWRRSAGTNASCRQPPDASRQPPAASRQPPGVSHQSPNLACPPWPTMAHHGPPWPTMAHHSLPWPTMAHHGPPWPTMAHYGPLWPTMAHYGPLWPTMTHHGPCSPPRRERKRSQMR